MKSRLRLFSYLLLVVVAFAASSPGPAQAQGRGATRDIPYATNFAINVNSGNGATATSPDAVPLNKRLVIEFVSVMVSSAAGEKPSFFLYDSVNGAGRFYWIPLTLTDPSSGAGVYRASELVRLSHDGNGVDGPGAACTRNANSFSAMTCSITLSGYLVDK
jgi:hypothetical protein